MIYRFLIFHSEAAKGLNKLTRENVLDEDEVLMEYAQFGTPFELYFQDVPGIRATYRAVDPAQDGIMVTLESDLDPALVKDKLAAFLVRMNKSISGLSLIGTAVGA